MTRAGKWDPSPFRCVRCRKCWEAGLPWQTAVLVCAECRRRQRVRNPMSMSRAEVAQWAEAKRRRSGRAS